MEAAPDANSDVNAVVFNLGATVIRMDLNPDINELKMTSWLKISWMDFRLKWNPEAYGGITNIRLPATSVWVPDVEVRKLYYKRRIVEKMKPSDLSVVIRDIEP